MTTKKKDDAPPVTLTMTTRCTLCGEKIETSAHAWSPEVAHAMRLPAWTISATAPDGRFRWNVVACGFCVRDKFPRLAELLDEEQAEAEEREKKQAAEAEQMRAEDVRRQELRKTYGPELRRVESTISALRRELARCRALVTGSSSFSTAPGASAEDVLRERDAAERSIPVLEADLEANQRRADELRVLVTP